MRRRCRKDLNHDAICGELTAQGFSVRDLHNAADSGPDILIGRNGLDAQVEIKSPRGRKTPLERLEPDQVEFAQAWRGCPVIVAFDSETIARRFIEILTARRRL